MKNTEKIYIGKGIQIKNFDMFNITINLDKVKGHTFLNKAGETLVNFTFSKTKEADQFGKTHTAFLQVESIAKVEEPVEKQKTKKAKKVKEPLELSFANH